MDGPSRRHFQRHSTECTGHSRSGGEDEGNEEPRSFLRLRGQGVGRAVQHSEVFGEYCSLVCEPEPHLQVGTLKVATSGYEPWKDYPVKGWWLDSLWSEHKLRHDVYIRYALGPYRVADADQICYRLPFV